MYAGIVDVTFKINRLRLNLIDVGGQRSERRKWLHCFESVHAVVFIAAINEFDLVLEEDGVTNR